ncbi:hypothetical protein [Dactylosporangium sp. NPDC051541]|uniref:hypothetical protein n=1 Tax=Dactylosporangium sp. NPDC051541 TaxID=3363977 RepID=UPI0037A40BEF
MFDEASEACSGQFPGSYATGKSSAWLLHWNRSPGAGVSPPIGDQDRRAAERDSGSVAPSAAQAAKRLAESLSQSPTSSRVARASQEALDSPACS